MLPEIVAKGREVLDARLQPCGADAVGRILAPLTITLRSPGTYGLSEEQAGSYFAIQRERYAELLKHVPQRILEQACIAHERASSFFPTAHELLKHAEPEIQKLRWQRRWLDRLPITGQAPPKPAADREPLHVRLLGVLKWQEREGSPLYNLDKAAKTRRELAKLSEDERLAAEREGRAIDDWAAIDYTAGLPPPPEEPAPLEPSARVGTFRSAAAAAMEAIPRRVSPQSEAALKRSLAKQHRAAGRTAYADHLERQADELAPRPPDVRTDVLEGDLP